MLKRFGILILIYIFFLLSLGARCDAQGQYSATLTKMEKSLFGMDYGSQTDDSRLKRIEEIVYGKSSSSTVFQRIDKLSKDLSVDVMGQEIKPKSDTFAEDENAERESNETVAKADANINYPIVNKLEQTVFNKEFKTTEIKQRLSSLEQQVFQKAYSDDLNTRVERLKSAVLPQKVANNSDSENDFSDEDSSGSYRGKFADETGYGGSYTGGGANLSKYDDMMSQTSQFQDDAFGTYGGYSPPLPGYSKRKSVLDSYQYNSDIAVPLSALEKKVLKQSFPDDSAFNRLSRLELRMFNSNFTDDDEQTRFDRVASAYQAQKTSKKYDGNKFAQHSATAMQIGAILLMILAAVL